MNKKTWKNKGWTKGWVKGWAATLTLALVLTGASPSLSFGAVASGDLPALPDYGVVKWASAMGSNYTEAPTPPLVHGAYLYVGSGSVVKKLNKDTGALVGQISLEASLGFPAPALTYAENIDGNGLNVLFAPLEGGRVQAIDADTMTSLWITQNFTGQNCFSRVEHDDNYIYFGTWQNYTDDGYFLCYSATDEDKGSALEVKAPVWQVTHAGGFYWSDANAQGDTVVFGSEDAEKGYVNPSSPSASLYSCMKGDKFRGLNLSPADSPVIDQATILGDVRSGVSYDSATGAYFFTSRAGNLYKAVVKSDGKFDRGTFDGDSPSSVSLGGDTTGTPTVYKGKVYVGIQGPMPFGSTGHMIQIIDGATMTLDASCTTPGFVQSETLLSTAQEEAGKLFLYMTCNQLPGGIYYMEIRGKEGKKYFTSSSATPLFTPPSSMQNYGISPLTTDNAGTLYYKNDSCNVIAVTAGYLLQSIGATGGSITDTCSVLAGQDATFNLTASSGYKTADLKVDGVSQKELAGYTFEGVTAPHKIQGIFIRSVTPNLTGAASGGYNSVKLTWAKGVGVSGYQIFRATSPTGTYSKLKTVSSGTTTYTNTGLTTGKPYYYKIRGYYRNTLGTVVYSGLSTGYKCGIPKLATPVLTTTAGVDKIKLTWKAISGAQGYRIYKKTSSTSSYTRVKTITSGATTTWTNTGLTTGKTYYYKIVAYRVVNGKYCYSSYSAVSYKKPN